MEERGRQPKEESQKQRGHQQSDYEYTSLPDEKNSIRLVELLPGTWGDKIRCNMHIEAARPFRPYEAISYCWGDPNHTADIICNGRVLRITRNLKRGLRQLRHPEESRILWADAICIKQQDLKERGHQVMQMGTIFKEAYQVLTWLGRGTNIDVKAAFDLVEALESRFAGLGRKDRRIGEKLAGFIPNSRKESWNELNKLLDYPWFRRIWVVQEVSLARQACVVCGNYSLSWDTFSTVCMILTSNKRHLRKVQSERIRTSRGLSAASRMHRMDFKGERSNPSVLGVLYSGWKNFKSKDPRDKVYALLGHPAFEHGRQMLSVESFILVNYGESPSNTFMEAAKRVIELEAHLKVLSYVCHKDNLEEDDQDFISWVPRWDSSSENFQEFGKLHRLPGPSAFLPKRFSVQDNHLNVEGNFVDLCRKNFQHLSSPQ